MIGGCQNAGECDSPERVPFWAVAGSCLFHLVALFVERGEKRTPKIITAMMSVLSMSLIAGEDALPRMVDAVDKCESLWRDGRYSELYKYVDELENRAPCCVPTSILIAWRKEHFGCQYEEEAAILRGITNQIRRVLCEVNPCLLSRVVDMANFADEMASEWLELNEDKEYRLINEDPRLNGHKSSAPYVPFNFADVPFVVPDFGVVMMDNENGLVGKTHQKERKKALPWFELGKIVLLESRVPFKQKKALLDDYVSELVSTSGVKNLVAQFDNGFVQIDGYYSLCQLRERGQESKQALMDYVSQDNAAIGADEAKRMAVWALLQFAHDDPEVATYLRQLPPKIDKRNWKTSEYLKMAIKHLDEGCPRHFVPKGIPAGNADDPRVPDSGGSAVKKQSTVPPDLPANSTSNCKSTGAADFPAALSL